MPAVSRRGRRLSEPDGARGNQTILSRCPILFFFASRYLRERSVGLTSKGNALHDLEPVAPDRDVLGGVVGHQPHLANAEVPEDLAPHPVVADVGRKTELLVRRDRVVPLVLELVRLELVEEADSLAPPGAGKGRPPVPPPRSSRAPSWSCSPQSQRADPKTSPVRHWEWTRTRTGLLLADLAEHEGEVLLVRDVAAIREEAEFSETGRQVGGPQSAGRGARASSGAGSGPPP